MGRRESTVGAGSVPDGMGCHGGEAEGEGASECLHLLPNLWVFVSTSMFAGRRNCLLLV
jgi:hypothetical protein